MRFPRIPSDFFTSPQLDPWVSSPLCGWIYFDSCFLPLSVSVPSEIHPVLIRFFSLEEQFQYLGNRCCWGLGRCNSAWHPLLSLGHSQIFSSWFCLESKIFKWKYQYVFHWQKQWAHMGLIGKLYHICSEWVVTDCKSHGSGPLKLKYFE